MMGQGRGESIGEGDDDSGGGDGNDSNVYKGNAELVLVSLFNPYSEDNEILVCDSRYFSYPAYISTDYLVY